MAESISCRQCGAPLTLFGGGRVRTITCGYCGTQMDLADDYSKLSQFLNQQRPDLCFKLGQEGELFGVKWTIIGLIEEAYIDHWDELTDDRWVSYQLFSALYGYAWLTENKGHLSFSRRIRELPDPAWPRHMAAKRKAFEFRGEKYRFYEAYKSQITYVEGCLTWEAKLGDRIRVIQTVTNGKGVDLEMPALETQNSNKEIEYFLNEYVPHLEVNKQFGTNLANAKRSISPIEPFQQSPLGNAFKKVAPVFLAITAVICFGILVFGEGRSVYEDAVFLQPGGEFTTSSFQLSQTIRPVTVEVGMPVTNSWAAYDAELYDENDNAVKSFSREISYYEGYENGELWTEGSQRARSRVRIESGGTYYVSLTLDEQSPQPSHVRIKVTEGQFSVRYFFILLIIFAFASLWPRIARRRFEKKRWKEAMDDD